MALEKTAKKEVWRGGGWFPEERMDSAKVTFLT